MSLPKAHRALDGVPPSEINSVRDNAAVADAAREAHRTGANAHIAAMSGSPSNLDGILPPADQLLGPVTANRSASIGPHKFEGRRDIVDGSHHQTETAPDGSTTEFISRHGDRESITHSGGRVINREQKGWQTITTETNQAGKWVTTDSPMGRTEEGYDIRGNPVYRSQQPTNGRKREDNFIPGRGWQETPKEIEYGVDLPGGHGTNYDAI
jgi:hypothetical protein